MLTTSSSVDCQYHWRQFCVRTENRKSTLSLLSILIWIIVMIMMIVIIITIINIFKTQLNFFLMIATILIAFMTIIGVGGDCGRTEVTVQ